MRRSVRNLGFITGSDLLSRLLGFFAVTWLARALGVDNLGVIGFAMAALSYGLIGTDLGLLKFGTREVARDRRQVQILAGGIIGLRLVLAFIALAVIGVFAVVIPKPDMTKVVLITYAFALFPVALLLEWLFQGVEQMAHIAISRLLSALTYLVLVLALVRGPEHVLRVPLFWLAGSSVSAVYLLIVYRLRFGQMKSMFDLALWGALIRRSLSLGVATILSQVYMNFGLIVLGLLSVREPAGLFTAASRLVFFVLVIDRAFYLVAFPIIARRVRPENAAKDPAARAALEQFAKLILLITVPTALFTVALARPLMTLVYGARYAGAAPTLAVLVWLVLTTTMSSLYGYGLVALDRERQYAHNVAIGCGSVLILSVALILPFHELGAAIAVVAGEVVMLAFMFAGVRRTVHAGFLRFLWRPLLVSALVAAGLSRFGPVQLVERLAPLGAASLSAHRLEQLVLLALAILAIAIYIGIMYLVGGVGKEELSLLRANEPQAGADAPRSSP